MFRIQFGDSLVHGANHQPPADRDDESSPFARQQVLLILITLKFDIHYPPEQSMYLSIPADYMHRRVHELLSPFYFISVVNKSMRLNKLRGGV